MLPVVIGTNPERTNWLNDCLTSIQATSNPRRKIIIHRQGGYELAALRTGIKHRARFLYLHDSVQILHPDFWTTVDNTPEAWLFGHPPMYMGIYQRTRLAPILETAPTDVDKRTSINWEAHLPQHLTMPTLWPDVIDANGHIQEHHGRINLVLENHLIRKYKGTWS